MTSGGRRAAEFDRLLRAHIPAFYRAAYRWTGAVDQAEDLVQELLTRLFPRLDELRGLDQVRPWALRVMYRIFIDQLRRQRRSPVQYGFEAEHEEEGDSASMHLVADDEPETLVEQQLTQERVMAAWHLLSEDHRVVLSLHDIEEYSLVEIAAMIDAPVGTLKSRVHRARARLREILKMERFEESDRVTSNTGR